MAWKMVKHGERGCGDVSAEGPRKFIEFMFDGYKPPNAGAYAELFDDEGNLVQAKGSTPK